MRESLRSCSRLLTLMYPLSLSHLFALLCCQHDLGHHLLSSFVTIMGDACERLDPFPPALLDEILRQLTREVTASTPKCSELAVQLLQQDKYREVFERPVVMWLKETLVDQREGQATQLAQRRPPIAVNPSTLILLPCCSFL